MVSAYCWFLLLIHCCVVVLLFLLLLKHSDLQPIFIGCGWIVHFTQSIHFLCESTKIGEDGIFWFKTVRFQFRTILGKNIKSIERSKIIDIAHTSVRSDTFSTSRARKFVIHWKIEAIRGVEQHETEDISGRCTQFFSDKDILIRLDQQRLEMSALTAC